MTQTEKVLILADVQNIYYSTRQQFRCHFDYNAFWRSATNHRTVSYAFAYATDSGDSKQRQFQNILRGIGFEVKLKPHIVRADGSSKGDWDVGIAVDGFEYGSEVDTVILLSGDGDFAVLANYLRNKFNVRIEVYGVEALTAKTLIDAADHYIPIDGELLLQRR